MNLILLFSALFLIGAVANTSGPGGRPAAAAGYAASFLLLGMWRLLRHHAARTAAFLDWLDANREAIASAGATFDGLAIDRRTGLARYHVVLSFGFVTLKVPSRYYVAGVEAGFPTALLLSACSLVTGWWGFPWGPIRTLESVLTNLVGGEKLRVGDLLELTAAPERRVVRITEGAAEHARRLMAERGFPAGTALQVEAHGGRDGPSYRVTFDDRPPSDGSVWMDESHGVTIVVSRREAPRLKGLLVDVRGGEFVFEESWEGRIDADA